MSASTSAFRPATYVLFFKNETGQTLNQYLTDYRIKMSKQFLSDPRYKIADISSKVGYSDGNYYSKTFKKSWACPLLNTGRKCLHEKPVQQS